MNPVLKAFRWAAGEAWEKINIAAKWREIKEEGKKHGLRFVIFAVLWECIEDGLFPYLAIKNGMPALAPFFLIMHFEPLVYPAFFWACRMYDRSQGKIPWEPDRSVQSSNRRSAGKVGIYQMASSGWIAILMLAFGLAARNVANLTAIYVALMLPFGFIHERIWHDSNFGIDENDVVAFKRVAAKTFTYCCVSTTILASLFKVIFSSMQWHTVVTVQLVAMTVYLVLETIWSKSVWGLARVSRP